VPLTIGEVIAQYSDNTTRRDDDDSSSEDRGRVGTEDIMSWNGHPVIDLDAHIVERADRF